MNDIARKTPADDPRMAGTWWAFPPPPIPNYFFNLRRLEYDGRSPDVGQWYLWENKRLVLHKEGRHTIIGRRVSKMIPEKGWQFQFRPSGRERFRPHLVIYNVVEKDGVVQRIVSDRRDITGQLPMAYCIEEARYIVSQIPNRWPLFWHVHVEFIEEKLSS